MTATSTTPKITNHGLTPGPYYGVYEGKRNVRSKGDPDFRPLPGQVSSR